MCKIKDMLYLHLIPSSCRCQEIATDGLFSDLRETLTLQFAFGSQLGELL